MASPSAGNVNKGVPVVLGLGSNRSYNNMAPMAVLNLAFNAISSFLTDTVMSHVYRTKAMYVTDQDDFYNAVVTGFYTGTPQNLLRDIHRVEASFGRNRTVEQVNGPRSLDIDIELFGTQIVAEPDLIIPHERIRERAFVLVPLLEVLPESADPITGMRFKDILEKLPDQGVEIVKNQETT